MLEGPDDMPLNHSASFTLTCTITLTPEVNTTMVQMGWADPNFNPINTTLPADIVPTNRQPVMSSVGYSAMYTLGLNFSALKASQVGAYTCGAMLTDGEDTLNIIEIFSVSLQGKVITILIIILIFIQYLSLWLYLVSIQLVVYLKALMSHYYVMSLLL